MNIDISGQFRKLCKEHADETGMPARRCLLIVWRELNRSRSLGKQGQWAYDLNRHLALRELRDALMQQIAAKRRAA